MLGSDVVVAEATRLVYGQLDDAFGARGQPHFADDRAIAAADDEFDGSPHLGQLDVHVLENARGHAFALSNETEQQVLRSDVVVVEPLRLVLSQRQNLARAIRELVETIRHVPERLFLMVAKGDLTGMLARPASPVSGPGGWVPKAREVGHLDSSTASIE